MAQAFESGPFPGGKLPLLASHVYARCDDKDGLKDGLIDDPRRCDFRPPRDLPLCEGTRDDPDCFTRQQAGTLQKIYGDVRGGGKTPLSRPARRCRDQGQLAQRLGQLGRE